MGFYFHKGFFKLMGFYFHKGLIKLMGFYFHKGFKIGKADDQGE